MTEIQMNNNCDYLKPSGVIVTAKSTTILASTNQAPAVSRKVTTINYGIVMTPFGSALLGWTRDRVCYLKFCDRGDEIQLQDLSRLWQTATLKRDNKTAEELAEHIFSLPLKENEIPLLVQGTDFQINIWQALQDTRPGQTISYSQLARIAGSPKAQRATGSALAANPIVYLIPCHRVIKKNGELGKYGGGSRRKQSMLDWESKQNRDEQ